MANKNFVVHNGLTVGALTIDAVTGDLTTSGNIILSGGGGVTVSNISVSSISQNDSSISITDTGTGSSVSIIIDGATEHTVDADGVNLASGDRYAIAGTSVLNATTLGSGVVNSSLTTVGNLSALSVEGSTTLYGTTTFGAQINSNVVPRTDYAYDLGSSSKHWNNLYAASIYGNVLTASQTNITTVGNLTALSVAGDTTVYGNLTVHGLSTMNGGTLTIGDSNTDNVVFGADVNSNMTPNLDNSYDLGASDKQWRTVYAGTSMKINNAYVATVDDATALAIALG